VVVIGTVNCSDADEGHRGGVVRRGLLRCAGSWRDLWREVAGAARAGVQQSGAQWWHWHGRRRGVSGGMGVGERGWVRGLSGEGLVNH
jgi:hypothetical protein